MLISEALEGKYIKSYRNLRRGTIVQAFLRTDIYGLSEGVFAYACKVKPEAFGQSDFWTTVYVGKDSE